MTNPANSAGPELRTLLSLFPLSESAPEYELVAADEVPPPYNRLLVHEHHMTVTVEEFHGDLVDVRVLAQRQDDDAYARMILLALQHSGKVVQFGIMRVQLRF